MLTLLYLWYRGCRPSAKTAPPIETINDEFKCPDCSSRLAETERYKVEITNLKKENEHLNEFSLKKIIPHHKEYDILTSCRDKPSCPLSVDASEAMITTAIPTNCDESKSLRYPDISKIDGQKPTVQEQNDGFEVDSNRKNTKRKTKTALSNMPIEVSLHGNNGLTCHLPSYDEIFKYGVPDCPTHTYNLGKYVSSYHHGMKIPIWVAEFVDRKQLIGSANRKCAASFNEHPVSAVLEDYVNSGWSKGHMAPSSNYKCFQTWADATFSMYNIVPQDTNHNSKIWSRLEKYVQGLAKKHPFVNTITVALFLPQEGEYGKKYVKYEVIGPNQVSVPTHLVKIIVADNGPDPPTVEVYVIPNKSTVAEHDFRVYKSSLKFVQEKTGINYLPNL